MPDLQAFSLLGIIVLFLNTTVVRNVDYNPTLQIITESD